MSEPPKEPMASTRSPGPLDPRLREMEDELRSMAGREVLLELNSLDSSARVFTDNYRELRQFLMAVRKNPDYAFLGLDQARKQQKEEVFAETLRLIHNFLASSFSLVDHTRCTRDRIAPALKTLYEEESVQRFASDGVAKFWQELRNYQTHYRPVPLTLVGQGYLEQNPTHSLVMKRKDLLEWKGWKSVARTWLRDTSDDIEILSIATDYFEKVKDFQLWFGEQMRQERRADLKAFYEREEEYFLLFIETRLDVWLADPDAGPLGDRGLFLHIFDLADFETLEAMPPASTERTDAALAILRRHFRVPGALAYKFARAYSDRRFFL